MCGSLTAMIVTLSFGSTRGGKWGLLDATPTPSRFFPGFNFIKRILSVSGTVHLSSFLFILETHLLRTWWKSKEILNDNLKKWQWNSIVPQKKIKNKQRNTLLTNSTHEVFICDGISLRGIKGMHTCWFVFNWSLTIPRIPKHNQLFSIFITYAIYFWTPAAFFRLTKCDPPRAFRE